MIGHRGEAGVGLAGAQGDALEFLESPKKLSIRWCHLQISRSISRRRSVGAVDDDLGLAPFHPIDDPVHIGRDLAGSDCFRGCATDSPSIAFSPESVMTSIMR